MSSQSPFFLKFIRIERFGRFSDKVIGPFDPHLNIVYGPNEAGKTTVASFVGGVLFGWEEARGNRNTYKPVGAERSGSLIYAAREGEEARTLSRTRNADGLQGNVELVEDIDKETFRTMFSLDSDELRSLRNATDTTAKLLTAGSGTSSSPAHALAHINEKLAAFTSRASSAEQSIPQLLARKNELREKEKHASDQADRWRAQDRELHELTPEVRAMGRRVDESNALVEKLTVARSTLESLDEESDKLSHESDRFSADERDALEELNRRRQRLGRRLSSMTAAEDRALRDRLEALGAREARLAHATETAQGNYTSSKAVYEALLETADDEADRRKEKSKRAIQLAFLVVIPAVLFLLGVPLFLEGRARGSLSYMAIGVALSVFAALMALGGFFALFRPNKEEVARKERFDDAHWVMVQDKKKLEACQAEEAAQAQRTAAELSAAGLEGVVTLRQARVVLDEASDARGDIALCLQRQQAASSRLAQTERRQSEIARERRALLAGIGLPADADLSVVEEELEHRLRQRAGLLETFEAMSRRAGELTSLLAHAADEVDYDQLKMDEQMLSTRITDAKTDFARLLLAKHMLEVAIASWESTRQPEVYACASSLLSLMTDGRWREVSLTDDGTLQVVDAAKTARLPVHLSLGTCQQLYLALRIALLLEADNVGAAVPILADDILVNFDERRRTGAAKALAQLAEKRQVVLFTCHEEVVRVLKKAAKQTGHPATLINL